MASDNSSHPPGDMFVHTCTENSSLALAEEDEDNETTSSTLPCLVLHHTSQFPGSPPNVESDGGTVSGANFVSVTTAMSGLCWCSVCWNSGSLLPKLNALVQSSLSEHLPVL